MTPTILEPIKCAVCQTFGVTPEQLVSRSRKRPIAEARFAYIAKAYETHRYSQRGLAMLLGFRQFTIKHAIDRAKELRDIDSEYASRYLANR